MDVPTMLLTFWKIIWSRKFTGWVWSPKLVCQNHLIYFSPKLLSIAPKRECRKNERAKNCFISCCIFWPAFGGCPLKMLVKIFISSIYFGLKISGKIILYIKETVAKIKIHRKSLSKYSAFQFSKEWLKFNKKLNNLLLKSR